MPKPTTTKPNKPAPTTTTTSGPVNTDLRYGILDGRYVTYKVLADGREELWSTGDAIHDPRPILPAGSVGHPVTGVGYLGAIKVFFWVDGAGRKVCYAPPEAFGKVL